MNILKKCALVLALAWVTGCATKIKTVPFTVNSDPLGAYVLLQVQADREDERSYDWVFLGNTPLNTRRGFLAKDLKNADAFVIRVMKEGYVDQQKSWTGRQIVNDAKTKGAVHWNPKLISSN